MSENIPPSSICFLAPGADALAAASPMGCMADYSRVEHVIALLAEALWASCRREQVEANRGLSDCRHNSERKPCRSPQPIGRGLSAARPRGLLPAEDLSVNIAEPPHRSLPWIRNENRAPRACSRQRRRSRAAGSIQAVSYENLPRRVRISSRFSSLTAFCRPIFRSFAMRFPR